MQNPSKSQNGAVHLKNNPMTKVRASGKTKMVEPSEVRWGGKFTRSKSENAVSNEVTIDERQHLIAEAAYYRAMRRSFVPGNELEDWLEAEAEIERMLSESGMDSASRNA
jgi:hypothetical protein